MPVVAGLYQSLSDLAPFLVHRLAAFPSDRLTVSGPLKMVTWWLHEKNSPFGRAGQSFLRPHVYWLKVVSREGIEPPTY